MTPIAWTLQTATFQAVADFILTTESEDFPVSTRRMAALLLLDTLGIAIAASPMSAGVIARQTACLLYGGGDGHSARLLFDGRRVSAAGAAFAAASQIDNLDGHDGYNPTKGHIGVVAVPTLAALAENLPNLTGPDALGALIVGYEVAGRAGIALHASVPEYHTSGAWNALGVVAMGARMRQSGSPALRQALGIAEYHGPRSQMMREIANPTMLHDGSGMGALVGLSAIIMAELGFTGAPAITIEAPEVAPHWTDLGQFWQIEHQYIKPYPVCRWAHASIDAARELCIAHDLRHDQIAQIRIHSFHNAVQLFPTMPDTTSKAQYSLPFSVANMILHGRIGLEHVSDAGLHDPRVADLVARTVMIESPRHEARYPIGRWANVEFTLTDGRILDSGDVHARGGPERPFSEADIVAKYREFAVPVIGKIRADAIHDAVLSLQEADSQFATLADLLYDRP